MAEIGPLLPKNLKNELPSVDLSSSDTDEDNKGELHTPSCLYGPSLPAEGRDQSVSSVDKDHIPMPLAYGPALPPSILKGSACDSTSKSPISQGPNCVKKIFGPAMPGAVNLKQDSDSSDDEVIGPMPSTGQEESSLVEYEIEERAKAMKEKLTTKPEANVAVQREEWMTELPPEFGVNLGVTARKFRTHVLSGPEADRSVWTDTPADKERRKKEKAAGRNSTPVIPYVSAKDKETRKQVEYNQRKRPMSLLELHREKRKKEGSTSEGERKPFDRDRDLALPRVDSKAKSTFINKSKALNSRFQEGKLERKFL